MLKIILCALFVLDVHKNCNGNWTRKDEWRQQIHRLRRNYSSQSQNENPDKTGSSQNQHSLNYPVFGSRLKPRVRVYFDYPIETIKSENFDKQVLIPTPLRRHNGQNQNSENLSYTESSTWKNNNRGNPLASAGNKQKSQNSLKSDSQSSFEIFDLQGVESQSFGKRLSRDYFGINFNQNAQNQKSSQNLFGTSSNQQPKSLLSFRSRNSQNGQYIPPFRSGYGQKNGQSSLKSLGVTSHNFIGSQNIFESNCNATSNTVFIRKPGLKLVYSKGQNPFKGRDYLPPIEATTIYKAEEYLPPNNKTSLLPPTNTKPCCTNGIPSITSFKTTKRTFNTITTSRRYYTIDKITMHPFYTTTMSATRITNTTSEKPYYIPIHSQIPKTTNRPYCYTCASTNGPSYIPVNKPLTTILNELPKTNRLEEPTTEVEVFKNMTKAKTTTTSRPFERGDVPDDEDITTPRQGAVGPAMAMPVPPEPDEPIPTTMSPATTSFSTTEINTTPLITPNTTMLMTTEMTEYNRRGIYEKSLPTLAMDTTLMTTSKLFKAPKYLPPEDPIANMPALNTTSSDVAPAMAMPVPPEPEEDTTPIPLSAPETTIITTSPLTTSIATSMTTNRTSQTMITPDDNRHLLEEESGSTTTMIIETTATTTFKAPEYLPPKYPTKNMPDVNSTSSDPGPAIAMPVPPEPAELPLPLNPMPPSLPTTTTMTIPPSSTSNTTSRSINRTVQTMSTDSYRHLLEESPTTLKMQTTTPMPYKRPQYLSPEDPKRNMPPK